MTSTGGPRPSAIGRNARPGLAVTLIVAIAAIMVLGSFAGINFPTGATAVSPGTHLTGTPHAASRTVAPPGTAPTSGNGTFWINTPMQNVSTNVSVCTGVDFYVYPNTPLCGPTNITNEPSVNLSDNGVLFTAYTAYTNQTPCETEYPQLDNYTDTEIGVSASTDGGASWSTPQYLGNTVCNNATEANNYIDSWQPTVTSLSNGTLVIAWVEFNISVETGCLSCTPSYFPDLQFQNRLGQGYDYNSSQLVVAFSYDNGTSWTNPSPVNTSTFGGYYCSFYCRTYANWIQQRPSITAVGQTIYLAWTNITLAWEGY
ncbi:MAG: hypothetical protein L3K03_09675, partial [Thermoplasmata archaeon]|nr:hypothetical protein [Thermoplasmata archaeon]